MCRATKTQKITKKSDIIEREMKILEEIHKIYEDMIEFDHKLENSLVKRMDEMEMDEVEKYEKLKKFENKNEEKETQIIAAATTTLVKLSKSLPSAAAVEYDVE